MNRTQISGILSEGCAERVDMLWRGIETLDRKLQLFSWDLLDIKHQTMIVGSRPLSTEPNRIRSTTYDDQGSIGNECV